MRSLPGCDMPLASLIFLTKITPDLYARSDRLFEMLS